MAVYRSEQQWAHTSAILAMIANVNRDPKHTPSYKPDDFNPHARRRKRQAPLPKVGIEILKTVFVDNRPGAMSRGGP
jgi:hypothetical protein